MAEYIERDAALAFMNDVEPCICHDLDGVVFTATKDSDMLEFLRAIPAADVAPVVRGHWEKYSPTWFRCSFCGIVTNLIAANYCPNCGAKMDMEAE